MTNYKTTFRNFELKLQKRFKKQPETENKISNIAKFGWEML